MIKARKFLTGLAFPSFFGTKKTMEMKPSSAGGWVIGIMTPLASRSSISICNQGACWMHSAGETGRALSGNQLCVP